MIFGIGTDILKIERIRAIDSLDKFASKILSNNESKLLEKLNDVKKSDADLCPTMDVGFPLVTSNLFLLTLTHFSLKVKGTTPFNTVIENKLPNPTSSLILILISEYVIVKCF